MAEKKLHPRVAKLRAAWKRSGLTQTQLIKRAKMGISQGAMSRRLDGLTPVTLDEHDALSRVLAQWMS